MDRLQIPYPDFQMGELIDPEQHDLNNVYIQQKANELIDFANDLQSGGGAQGIKVTPTAPFTSTTIQTLFNEIITRLKATQAGVSGGKLIGVPALVKLAGNDVEAQLKALDNLLQTAYVVRDSIANGAVTVEKLASSSVSTPKVVDGAITTPKIANSAVTQEKIADGHITQSKIGNNAVTRDKISDGAITEQKLSNNSVTRDKVAPNAVHNISIAPNAVTQDKIADGAVTGAKFANNSITNEKMADGAISGQKLSDNSVSGRKLTDDTIGTRKFQDDSITINKLDPSLRIVSDETILSRELYAHVQDKSLKHHVHHMDTIPVDLEQLGVIFKVDGTTGDIPGVTSITELEDMVNTVSAQLAQTVHLNVKNFFNVADTTYDAAIQRALESVTDNIPVELKFPRGKYKLNNVITRRKNLTVIAKSVEFTPQSKTDFMWVHYGDNFSFEGGTVTPEVYPQTSDTFRGFKILNDISTKMSNYACFKDTVMENLYQGIEFYMDGTVGGASYRHKLQNVRVRNATVQGRDWVGSFGIKFGGNVSGDAAGNDSKLIDVYIKGYEKNLIVQNSTALKATLCSIDGGKVAIELDSSSHFTISQSYIEYNETFLSALNSPYRPMVIATTVSNFTNYLVGSLYASEEILNYSAESPWLALMKRNISGVDKSIVRTGVGHGSGLYNANENKSVDFLFVGNKFGIVPSDDIDLYDSIPVGKKRYFGNFLGSKFSSIDEDGFIYYENLIPNTGITEVTTGTTSINVGRNVICRTNNTVATTINYFRYGKLGQRLTLIIGDAFTTIAHHSDRIRLKGKANKTYAVDDTLEFICISVTSNNTQVWIEV